MPDDKRKRGSPDTKLIALEEKWERDYWTKRLNVSLTKLRAAVKAVGPSARKVRAWLKACELIEQGKRLRAGATKVK